MIYYILFIGFLLFLITFLMLCSCKKRKLNTLFHKFFNILKKILNDLINYISNYINEDEMGINKYFLSKSKKENDFFNYIGPQHGRNEY